MEASDAGRSSDIDAVFRHFLDCEPTTRNIQHLIAIAVATSGMYFVPILNEGLQQLQAVPEVSFATEEHVTAQSQAILLSTRTAVKLLMTGYITEIAGFHISTYAEDSCRVFLERMRAIDKRYRLGVIGEAEN